MRILYNKEGKTVEVNILKGLYAPHHSRARRLENLFKKTIFGLDVIFKNTKTLGDIILKKENDLECI